MREGLARPLGTAAVLRGLHQVIRRERDLRRLAKRYGFELARTAGRTSSWQLTHPASGTTVIASWTPSDRADLRIVAGYLRRALRNGRERMR